MCQYSESPVILYPHPSLLPEGEGDIEGGLNIYPYVASRIPLVLHPGYRLFFCTVGRTKFQTYKEIARAGSEPGLMPAIPDADETQHAVPGPPAPDISHRRPLKS